MSPKRSKIVLVSTPVGYLGSGLGGGVEITLFSILKGLSLRGHEITLIAPEGSELPSGFKISKIKLLPGVYQKSWQHQNHSDPAEIPVDGVLQKLWKNVISEHGKSSDAILNFGYDWLPIWISQFLDLKIYHLISMGNESALIKNLVQELSISNPHQFAFHSKRQANDYKLNIDPIIVGNGFEINNYKFQSESQGRIGWAGRIAPEKGLEDAAEVANSIGEELYVWGILEDINYLDSLRNKYPNTINYRGFLTTSKFQNELGKCRTLLNTPKWNEAYGNVVVESMACGVPVIAYDRGGPGELIKDGETGFIISPDNINEMKIAISKVDKINRRNCREWFENNASMESFTNRIENWILKKN